MNKSKLRVGCGSTFRMKGIMVETIIGKMEEFRREFMVPMPLGSTMGSLKQIALNKFANDEQIAASNLNIAKFPVRMKAFSKKIGRFLDVDAEKLVRKNGHYRLEFAIPDDEMASQQQKVPLRSILRRVRFPSSLCIPPPIEKRMLPSTSTKPNDSKFKLMPKAREKAIETMPQAEENDEIEDEFGWSKRLRQTPDRQQRKSRERSIPNFTGQKRGRRSFSTNSAEGREDSCGICSQQKEEGKWNARGTAGERNRIVERGKETEKRLEKDGKAGKIEQISLKFELRKFSKFIREENENGVENGKIVNFLKLNEKFVESEPKMAHGIEWSIRIWVCTEWKKKKNQWRKSKQIGVFLKSNLGSGNLDEGWKVPVEAEFRIAKEKCEKHKVDSIVHQFSPRADDYGFEKWISTGGLMRYYRNDLLDSVRFTIKAKIGRPYKVKKPRH